MTRFASILLTLVVALLLFSPTASAGGWATITFDPLPTPIEAGETVTVRFLVKQHGNNPVHVAFDQTIVPRVTIQTAADSKPIMVEAVPEKEVGYYTAQVTFPAEGDYTMSVTLNVLQVEAASQTVTVTAASAEVAEPLVAGATDNALAGISTTTIVLSLGILLLVGGGIVAIARTR
jgi:hypothetical protein